MRIASVSELLSGAVASNADSNVDDASIHATTEDITGDNNNDYINPTGARCAACGRTLKPVIPSSLLGDNAYDARGVLKSFQYEDALEIDLHGGYGMFFDYRSWDELPVRILVCGRCARKLLDDNPWLRVIIDSIESGDDEDRIQHTLAIHEWDSAR